MFKYVYRSILYIFIYIYVYVQPPSKPTVLGILNVGDGIMMVIMAGEFPWQWLISRKTRLFKLHFFIYKSIY